MESAGEVPLEVQQFHRHVGGVNQVPLVLCVPLHRGSQEGRDHPLDEDVVGRAPCVVAGCGTKAKVVAS